MFKTNLKYVYWNKNKWHIRKVEDGKVVYVGLASTLAQAAQIRAHITDGISLPSSFTEKEGRLCKACNKTTCRQTFDVLAYAPSMHSKSKQRVQFDAACRAYYDAKAKQNSKAAQDQLARINHLAMRQCHHCRCVSSQSQTKRRVGKQEDAFLTHPLFKKRQKRTEVEVLREQLYNVCQRLATLEGGHGPPPILF